MLMASKTKPDSNGCNNFVFSEVATFEVGAVVRELFLVSKTNE